MGPLRTQTRLYRFLFAVADAIVDFLSAKLINFLRKSKYILDKILLYFVATDNQ